jgi:hypothetical protein
MEMLIVVLGLVAAAGGALVLLVCLAGRRAQLVKAFNMQQEREARERQLEEKMAATQKKQTAVAIPVASVSTAN